MKVRLRTGLSTDVRPRACAQRRRSKITRAMMAPPPPRSDWQRLVFNDTPQDDGVTLSAIGVGDGGAIHLVMAEPEGEPEPEPEPAPKEEEALVPNVPATSAEAASEEP